MPDHLLPHPSLAISEVALYLLAGIGFCAVAAVPLPRRLAHPGADAFGTGLVRFVLTIVTVLVCVVLWPVALLWTMLGRPSARRAAGRPRPPALAHAHANPALGLRSGDDPAELPVYLEQTLTSRPAPDPAWAGADWTQTCAAGVVQALTQRRFLDAAWIARSLAWDVEMAFGPNSSQLLHATELLAHVCHEIGDEARAVQLYARAATGWARNWGAGHPSARAARARMAALWAKDRAEGAAQDCTAVLVAATNRLFAQAAPTGDPSGPLVTEAVASL